MAKFDGVNWIIYNRNNSGLPCDSVNTITIDGQGNKWIGTERGLAKFDDVNWTVYNSELPSGYIAAIEVDRFGNKWIGISSGFVVYREGGVIVDVEKYVNEIPSGFALHQNYPNPFNPSTTIEFNLPERANVKLVIYDVLGHEVRVLVDGEYEAGRYKVKFDAGNLSSRVYFYELRAGKFRSVRKMVMIK